MVPKAYPKEVTFSIDNVGNVQFKLTSSKLFMSYISIMNPDLSLFLSIQNELGTREESLSFPFNNFYLYSGENTVKIIARSKDGTLIAESREAVFVPDITVFDIKGINFILEGDSKLYPRDLIANIADIIETMNLFLNEKHKIRIVEIEKGDSDNMYASPLPDYSDREGWGLGGQSHYFKRTRNEILEVFWHECAHSFGFQIGWPDRNYTSLEPSESSTDIWAFFEASYNRLGEQSDENKLFAIFDESNYQNIPSEHGHPHADPQELFASASHVLKSFPLKFMQKASQLKPEEREKVIEVAKFVVKRYLEHQNCPKNFFDQNLLEYFGVKTKDPVIIK